MNVEELLVSKNIPYRLSGADVKVCCLNPKHNDKNPSMRIDKITGIFNCLSCGFKGNIFTYFGEAANWLQVRRDLLKKKINSKLIENIGLQIPSNAVYFDREWRDINPETYRKFNAFEHNNNEFIGRVVFPIYDISGKIICFVGRHLNSSHEKKYLIHPAKVKMPLYPTNVKPIKDRIILVEGIFDMMNLHDKGLTNALCCFGTRMVTKQKLELLKIKGVTGLDIIFDGDTAGEVASAEIRILAESVELNVREIKLKNTDPGELTASKVLKLKETLYD